MAQPRRQHHRRTPRGSGAAVAAPLALVTVTVAVLITLASGGDDPSSPATGSAVTTTSPATPAANPPAATERVPRLRQRPATPTPVAMRAIGAVDPDGDGYEHHEQTAQATDGDPGSHWATETYAGGLGKPGVGLVLDAGRPVRLVRLTVTTDTPGFTAQITAARDAPGGPFTPRSSPRPVAAITRFALHGPPARYYVVWITSLDRVAHINEVRGVRQTGSPR